MNREPVHISEPLVNVWRDIEAAYCKAHGLPIDGEPDETDEDDIQQRGRDPPMEVTR